CKGQSGYQSVEFSPDGTRLASGSNDGTVKIWDATASQDARIITNQSGGARAASLSPDGKRVAFATVGTWDETKNANVGGSVKVSDVITGQEVFSLKGHTSRINSVVFSPDSKRLASASSDQTVKVWDAQSGKEIFTL